MAIRVGINGFGRIGQTIVRANLARQDIEIVVINDLRPAEIGAHFLKYDSVHGKLQADVKVDGNKIITPGASLNFVAHRDPKMIPWKDYGVDVVLECTGKFTDREGAGAHLTQGVKKVIISAPGKDSDCTIVMGVNEGDYKPEHKIISNASCTTNCLAPVVKIIHENLGLVRGFMTTVHSYTNDQNILDASHSDLRRARAAALSQIPTSTGAAKAIGLVIPELKGKLDGQAIRVPTPNVSCVDLVAEVKTATTVEALNAMFQAASVGKLNGILGYSVEPLVSIDYNGDARSSIVDADNTKVMGGTLIKVLAWYDNETAFSHRMIDLTQYIGARL